MRNTIARMLTLSRQCYWKWRAARRIGRMGKGACINFRCTFTRNTFIGDYANFNGIAVAGEGRVSIGRYFHSGRDCHLITSFHNYDRGSRIPYGPHEDIHRDIEIGDFVWFGDRVTVLGGAKIGEGAVIQAGAVVVGDIPAMAVAGGNPARAFKYRDQSHFEQLKQRGLFF